MAQNNIFWSSRNLKVWSVRFQVGSDINMIYRLFCMHAGTFLLRMRIPSLVNQCPTLHMTMLNQRPKAERKWKPAVVNEHLLVGTKIVIPVLPSIGSYISDDARSCVNDDCFDLPALANIVCKSQISEKKFNLGDFYTFSFRC